MAVEDFCDKERIAEERDSDTRWVAGKLNTTKS